MIDSPQVGGSERSGAISFVVRHFFGAVILAVTINLVVGLSNSAI